MKHCIGIDIGGTWTRVALFNEKKLLIEEYKFKTHAKKRPENTLECVVDVINNWKKDFDFDFIGIGMPGPMDVERGIFLKPPNLPAWNNFNIKAYFKDKCKIQKILVENDARCNALANAFINDYTTETLIYITISTGVGLGIFSKGKIFQGDFGKACEIDLFNVNYKYDLKEYNQTGIENVVSGTAIKNIARYKKLNVSSAEEVFLNYNENKTKRKIIEDVILDIALLVANIFMIFDPTKVIIGGSVITQNDFIFKKIQEKVQENIHEEFKVENKLAQGNKNDIGILGAALLLDYKES